jgi:hypothetical protein
MLNSLSQISSYQSNLNGAVSQAISGAKPDLVAQEQKPERTATSREPSAGYKMTSSMESINKAIDAKVTEYFTQYPNGGSDQEFKQFIEGVKLTGI